MWKLKLFPLFRLDQILGRQGSKAKDVYESKQSLASRIVKTERQVNWFKGSSNNKFKLEFQTNFNC